MLIVPPCVVTLTWTLTDAQNRPLDALEEPTEFFVGGRDLLQKVEDTLAGQVEGFTTRIQLEPDQAFGEYRPELVCFESRALFPPELQAGMAFEGLPAGATSQGMPGDAIYVVTEVFPEHVVLDGNHPLAGIALRIELQVKGVRPASEDEIEAGSVGAGAVGLLAARAASEPLH